MSISKLKAELKKMQSFDEKAARDFAIKFCDEFRGSKGKCVVPVSDILVGARYQHSKSAHIASQLLEAIECLEKIEDHTRGFGRQAEWANEFLTKLTKESK